MTPILYSSTETQFTSNGIGRLRDCISCTVTEERNGKFECEFQYPVTGKRYADIQEGCIVSVTHDDNHDRQPFRIYRRSAPINGIVTFNARHISYDLNNIILQPFTGTSVTATFAQINGKSINANPFTFWTDKTTVADFTLEQPASVRAILGGVRGSILDVYGGEYAFDEFTVKLHANRGTNTGVAIRYGKNLLDITQEIDNGGTYNAVVPFWRQEDTVVMLDERVVRKDSNSDKIVVLDLSNSFQEQPTQAQLRSAAQSYLNRNRPWIPNENIKIDFVALWQTTQYKDVAVLQRVKLCDTVNVYYPALGVVAEGVKVIKTEYNALLDKYNKIELGEAKSSFADTIMKETEDQLETLQKSMITSSMMQKAIDHATQLITGGLGGHVVFKLNADGEPEEILVMDTDDVQTAVNVIRINMGGIGFSTNGYNGPFTTAWTIDGHFNADFITTGTLLANLIKAGTITDNANKNSWNLDTGEFINRGIIISDGTYWSNRDIPTRIRISGSNMDMYYDDNLMGQIGPAPSRAHSSTSYNGPHFIYLNEFVIGHYAGNYTAYNNRYERFIGDVVLDSSKSLMQINTAIKPMNGIHWDTPTIQSTGRAVSDNMLAGQYDRDTRTWYPRFYGDVRIDGTLRNRGAYDNIGMSYPVYCDIYGTLGRSSSSRRWKRNIKSIDGDEKQNIISGLRNIKVSTFNFNLPNIDPGTKVVGLIAEDVADNLPDMVFRNAENTALVDDWDMRQLVPSLLLYCQELNDCIDRQKTKIDELEARIARLETLVEALMKG